MPLDYQILLGSVQARLGRWDAARQELEKAIQHSPQRADGYLNLGFFYLETGNAPHARELLEKASRLMARGTKLLYTIRSRKNCDGLKPPESAESRDIQRGAFYSQLAEQLHSMKQRGAALEVFRLALEADPESASAHAGAGRVCWEMDSLPESRSLLERGLRLHPEFSQLHFVNGLVQQSLGASEEAIASYRKAIQLQGPNASALSWIQLGTAQAAGGKIAEAESSIRQGLSLDPGLAQGHYELGKVCFQQGRFECAEQSLEEAIQLDPRQVGAYYQLGLTCLRTGKREKGKRLLETFHRKKELYASDVAPMEPLASPSP
jgi:tetratricopeptide (TPR) repeat protein